MYSLVRERPGEPHSGSPESSRSLRVDLEGESLAQSPTDVASSTTRCQPGIEGESLARFRTDGAGSTIYSC
ncbi:unnamed protein product [Acanthoscelides obtectus]|uniref:Uncharacterized protein n=1 Tax=Acanthoscelides obtectus TaxID=200917 RepID=A0A9P0PMF3_ACAOB|nr:unnamed protein product [Acanthoscelides obtectus]CAK1670533.1 hypothetical protein AOBTE_LOCUS27656 [Acanthoscelides obtectus]